jgi:hypothetical protein
VLNSERLRLKSEAVAMQGPFRCLRFYLFGIVEEGEIRNVASLLCITVKGLE